VSLRSRARPWFGERKPYGVAQQIEERERPALRWLDTAPPPALRYGGMIRSLDPWDFQPAAKDEIFFLDRFGQVVGRIVDVEVVLSVPQADGDDGRP
jgi:hypothetical protein